MSLALSASPKIYKKLFTLKPPQRDGLTLTIRHAESQKSFKVRFNHVAFAPQSPVLALSDNENNIFLLDFSANKCWDLSKRINSIAIIEFSAFKLDELLIGDSNGVVHILNIQSGEKIGQLLGPHSQPIQQITFNSRKYECMVCSSDRASLWDLRSNTKLRVLNFDHNIRLKFVVFEPIGGAIILCFEDSFIQVWNPSTFSIKTQLEPSLWLGHPVKNASFSQDGKMMVLSFRKPILAIFLVASFKLSKLITLPESMQGLKGVEFVPEANDGGSNRFLAILTSRGIVFFYNFVENVIMRELKAEYAINEVCAAKNGSFFACVLSSGEVNLYNAEFLLKISLNEGEIRAGVEGKSVILRKNKQKHEIVKKRIKVLLGGNRLAQLLQENGEYPQQHRIKIWEQLLRLPGQKNEYNAIINHRMIQSFEDLAIIYPLENKRNLSNLRRLLDNVVTWAPFFQNVDYLPKYAFPFVKIFNNRPIACFEAVCSILVNWCQLWFEYFPLPPVNILSLVENLLIEHDPEVCSHFTEHKIPSTVYAWPILSSNFSEVLTGDAWKIFWDHILTNEISFIHCGVVAYVILQRNAILSLKSKPKLVKFFKTHHPVNVKKLIKKTYFILNNTNDLNHPRQFLREFRPLEVGQYPNFDDYPKVIVQKEEVANGLIKEYKKLRREELDLYKIRFAKLQKEHYAEMAKEEANRQELVEKAIKDQIEVERNEIKNYKRSLEQLREKFELDKLKNEDKSKKSSDTYETASSQEDLFLNHLVGLIKSNTEIKANEQQPTTEQHTKTEISGSTIKTADDLQILNLFTAIKSMDNLITEIEAELEHEKIGNTANESAANAKMIQFKTEVRKLELEYKKLMRSLAKYKADRSQ